MYVCVHTYKAPANVYIVYLVINCACIDNFHTGGMDHPLLSYSAFLQQYSVFCFANTLGCSCSFRTRQVTERGKLIGVIVHSHCVRTLKISFPFDTNI